MIGPGRGGRALRDAGQRRDTGQRRGRRGRGARASGVADEAGEGVGRGGAWAGEGRGARARARAWADGGREPCVAWWQRWPTPGRRRGASGVTRARVIRTRPGGGREPWVTRASGGRTPWRRRAAGAGRMSAARRRAGAVRGVVAAVGGRPGGGERHAGAGRTNAARRRASGGRGVVASARGPYERGASGLGESGPAPRADLRLKGHDFARNRSTSTVGSACPGPQKSRPQQRSGADWVRAVGNGEHSATKH